MSSWYDVLLNFRLLEKVLDEEFLHNYIYCYFIIFIRLRKIFIKQLICRAVRWSERGSNFIGVQWYTVQILGGGGSVISPHPVS